MILAKKDKYQMDVIGLKRNSVDGRGGFTFYCGWWACSQAAWQAHTPCARRDY